MKVFCFLINFNFLICQSFIEICSAARSIKHAQTKTFDQSLEELALECLGVLKPIAATFTKAYTDYVVNSDVDDAIYKDFKKYDHQFDNFAISKSDIERRREELQSLKSEDYSELSDSDTTPLIKPNSARNTLPYIASEAEAIKKDINSVAEEIKEAAEKNSEYKSILEIPVIKSKNYIEDIYEIENIGKKSQLIAINRKNAKKAEENLKKIVDQLKKAINKIESNEELRTVAAKLNSIITRHLSLELTKRYSNKRTECVKLFDIHHCDFVNVLERFDRVITNLIALSNHNEKNGFPSSIVCPIIEDLTKLLDEKSAFRILAKKYDKSIITDLEKYLKKFQTDYDSKVAEK